jgi:protein-tyrosine phosphatase
MRLLFVCTGNICRSPTAEGVTRALLKQAGHDDRFHLDSAGLGGWHVGDPPDARAIRRAASRGYELSAQRARQLTEGDFADFDLLLAMDRGHRREMLRACPGPLKARIKLFMEYAEGPEAGDVPDPYYGDIADFDHALDMVERGAQALVDALAAPPR